MAELIDTLEQLLDPQSGQISKRIGADESKTRTAIQSAVPALMAAFSQEAERGGGIREAIKKDHDGSIIDRLQDYLGGQAQQLSPRTTDGSGILKHVLGDRQPQMQQALSEKSGLDAGSIGKLLSLLAPVAMGLIGKKSSASSGGGFDLNDLGSVLGREKADARTRNPDLGDLFDSFTGGKGGKGGAGGALGDMLGGKDR